MSFSPDDAQTILLHLTRRLARAPVRIADGVAQLVRDAPEGRLDSLMRTPARRVVLDAIFWQMPRFLDRDRARGLTSSVRWSITGRVDGGADTYHLEFVDGDCRIVRDDPELDPRLTITVDGAEFVRLATGNSDAVQAYFTGRLRIGGDVMFAAKLVALFRTPKSGR